MTPEAGWRVRTGRLAVAKAVSVAWVAISPSEAQILTCTVMIQQRQANRKERKNETTITYG